MIFLEIGSTIFQINHPSNWVFILEVREEIKSDVG